MGHTLDIVAPIALAALGSTVGAPELGLTGLQGGAIGAGLGNAAVNYSHNHDFGSALKAGALGAGGSYLGSSIAGSLFPGTPSLGSTLGINPSAASSDIASLGSQSSLPWLAGSGSGDIASSLGGSAAQLLSRPIAGVAGGALGNQFGTSLVKPPTPEAQGPQPFVPSQSAAMGLPKSINSMSSLTPMQQASGLATQGLYGGGNGADEQAYFGNLINRQLVDQGGNVSPLSSLNPIETSYLDKLGFGGQSNSNSLLEALSKWKPNGQNA